MSTGTAIIKDALKAIGVHSVGVPAAPENIIDGMNALNSMLETWLSKNIIIGFTPLETPGDDLNEPTDTRNGIVWNLAICGSPYFDNGTPIVSPDLRSLARDSYNDISNLYKIVVIPGKVISSTTPLGEGNRRGVNNVNYFPKGTVIEN